MSRMSVETHSGPALVAQQFRKTLLVAAVAGALGCPATADIGDKPAAGTTTGDALGLDDSGSSSSPTDAASVSTTTTASSGTGTTGPVPSRCEEEDPFEPNDELALAECLDGMALEPSLRELCSREDVDIYRIPVVGYGDGSESGGIGMEWLEIDVVDFETFPVAVPEQTSAIQITILDSAFEPVATGSNREEPIASELFDGIYYAEIRLSADVAADVEYASYSVVADMSSQRDTCD